MAINLIKIFKLGPDVSFKGSPIVSPTTEASNISFPLLSFLLIIFPSLPTKVPVSINFFVLSQAPPELLIEIANYTPLNKAPGKRPATNKGWKNTPNTIGVPITINPGNIISFKEASVAIVIHL